MIDLPHELTSDDYAGHGDDLGMIALNPARAIGLRAGWIEDYGIKVSYFDPSAR